MSYHDTDLVTLLSQGEPARKTPKSQYEQIEVILLYESEDDIRIQTDEDAPPRWIPREGIKIIKRNGDYVTLRMTEKRAIDLNLA